MINVSRTCALVGLTALLSSCVDPDERLDDFSDRVIDAGEAEDIDAAEVDEIPEATGTFLMGFAPVVSPDNTFQFLTEITIDSSTGETRLDIEAQPLDAETLEPVGDPTGAQGVSVSSTAEFQAVFAELPPESEDCEPEPESPVTIPGEANPLSGNDLRLTATLEGEIRSEDLLCGDVRGYEFGALGCLNLDGSTFAMIRIDPDTPTEDLPEPASSCPDPSEEPDAGVDDPDAG